MDDALLTAGPSPQHPAHTLYCEHLDWLQSWLRRKLGNHHDAADLAQDVFLRVLSREPWLSLRQPRSYLSTIAQGLVIDHWRRRALELAWLDSLQRLPEPLAPCPESQLIWWQSLLEIDRLLSGLKPPVRQVFLLARVDGLSCRQIADQLGLSLATTERHLAQALRRCYQLRFES